MILSKRPFGEVRLAATEVDDGVFSLRSFPLGSPGRVTVDESERLSGKAKEHGFSATCNGNRENKRQNAQVDLAHVA